MVQVVRINGKPMPTKWIQMAQQFYFFIFNDLRYICFPYDLYWNVYL